MSDIPVVSVVIPVYNVENYLEQCLKSVCGQSYYHIEIILVNDGSTDRSGDICKSWRDRDKRIIYAEQENRGQGIARNRGIDIASGVYITFIDADDWVDKEYVRSLVNCMEINESDLCRTAMYYYDQQQQACTGTVNIPKVDAANLHCYGTPQVAGNLYYKSLFTENAIRMPGGRYEDMATFPLLALKAQKLSFTDKPLYYYRINTGNSTMDNADNIKYCTQAFEFLYKESKRLNLYDSNRYLILQISVLHLGAALKRFAERLSEDQYAEVLNAFRALMDREFPMWTGMYNQGSSLFDNLLYSGYAEAADPKVSIIVPVYNVEQYLRQCMDSIVNQVLHNIEIICVNDGSTDSSRSILQEYAQMDVRIKVIDKKNTGYGNSMNIGLSHARGEYIGIVESDDYADKLMFEKLYNIAYMNDVDIIKSNYFQVQSGMSRKFVEALWGFEYNKTFDVRKNKDVFYIEQSPWNALYKRTFLDGYGIRFNETPGASYQDTAFVFKVWSCAQKAIFIRDAFLNYRIDNESASVKSTGKVFCVCDEYIEIERFLDGDEQRKSELIFLMTALKFRTYVWNYNRLTVAFQYAFLLKMIEEMKNAEDRGLLIEAYWRHDEWEEVQRLLKDPEQYYRETAKPSIDENEYDKLLMLNARISGTALKKCLNRSGHIILYGAGTIGKRAASLLKGPKAFKDKLCFAVTEKVDSPQSIMDIPVCCIYDLDEYDKESVVMLTVSKKNESEMLKVLKQLNFMNIILVDDQMLKELKDLDVVCDQGKG